MRRPARARVQNFRLGLAAHIAGAGHEPASDGRRAGPATQYFEAAFASSPLAMAFLDVDRHFTKVNAACTQLWGFTEAELLERDIYSMVLPDDLSLTRRTAADLDAGRAPRRLEKRWVHKNGSIVTTTDAVTTVEDSDGRPAGLFTQCEDVTARRALEARLRELADHDELTGLCNRRSLRDTLEAHLVSCARYEVEGALLMLDLDGFKRVNDTRGHAAGDAVLVAVAGTLRHELRASDHIARLGGDEFAVLLPQADAGAAEVVAGKLVRAIPAAVGITVSSRRGHGHPRHAERRSAPRVRRHGAISGQGAGT